jgi:RNA polymerase sigma factor (sigma-70 family)
METRMGDVPEDLTATFEAERTRLRAVAYRVLGSVHEADDAVQEAWLRLSRTDVSDVTNLPAWLTTVTSRICLDMLRSRGTRAEAPLDAVPDVSVDLDPAHDAVLADQVGAALQVVLDTLSPAERLAFVLHDLFGLPFDEVSGVMGRTPAAVRQLASRGRRRVRSSDDETVAAPADRRTQKEVVTAFLEASKGGDLTTLLKVLDPDVVIRSDAAAAAMGSPALIEGRDAVAGFFNGAAQAARYTLVDGYLGAVWQHRGEVKVAFSFVLGEDGRVVEVELVGDPETLARMDLARP